MPSNKKVILNNLTVKDAGFFYKLYSHPALTEHFSEPPFLANETPVQFTERIIAHCEYIFTIRPKDHPHLIIGDCALHHWDKQNSGIALGGSLLPEYWGNGYMQASFELLIEIAKHKLGVKTLLAHTETTNFKAIRLVEKMGFAQQLVDGQNTTMRKDI